MPYPQEKLERKVFPAAGRPRSSSTTTARVVVPRAGRGFPGFSSGNKVRRDWAAAARLAKAEGVSLNQFIAAAVAEKVGSLETADDFLRRRAAGARPEDLLRFLRGAPDTAPPPEDAR